MKENTLTVELDDIISKEFSLTLNKVGTPPSGIYVSKLTSSVDGIVISGGKSLIDTIDGERPEQFRLAPFVQKLPMMDTNYILRAAQKLNASFGIESTLMNTCSVCGLDYTSNFRTTSEFFGPSID